MHPITHELLRIEELEESLPELSAQYASAEPYPHIVLDDVLLPEVLRAGLRGVRGDPRRRLDELPAPQRAEVRGQGHHHVGADAAGGGGRLHLRAVRGLPRRAHGLHRADGRRRHGRRGAPPEHDRRLPERARRLHRAPQQAAVAAPGQPAPLPEPHLGPELGRPAAALVQGHAARASPGWSRRATGCSCSRPTCTPTTGTRSRCWSPKAWPASRWPSTTSPRRTTCSTRSTTYRARPDDGLRRATIYLDTKALQGYDVFKRRLHLSDGAVSRTLGFLSRLVRPSRRP